MLESDLLRTFVAIAETKNFTKAGEIVGRTQSAISVQMRKLEDALGEVLFDRGSRGVLLTYKGEQLLTRARRVVSLLDETEASIKSSHLTGTVRLGFPEEFAGSLLPIILRRFAIFHPAVEVVVRLGQSATNSAALSSGLVDLAIIYEQCEHTHHEILRTDAIVWVTSIMHQTHLRSPVPVGMYSVETWDRALAMEALEERRILHRYCYYAEGYVGLLAAVQAGIAIAPLSRSCIPLDCRELTEAEGFSIVDESNVVLCCAAKANAAAASMAAAIRESFYEKP